MLPGDRTVPGDPTSTRPPSGPGTSVGCRRGRAEVSPEVGPAAWAQTWGLERDWWEGGSGNLRLDPDFYFLSFQKLLSLKIKDHISAFPEK